MAESIALTETGSKRGREWRREERPPSLSLLGIRATRYHFAPLLWVVLAVLVCSLPRRALPFYIPLLSFLRLFGLPLIVSVAFPIHAWRRVSAFQREVAENEELRSVPEFVPRCRRALVLLLIVGEIGLPMLAIYAFPFIFSEPFIHPVPRPEELEAARLLILLQVHVALTGAFQFCMLALASLSKLRGVPSAVAACFLVAFYAAPFFSLL